MKQDLRASHDAGAVNEVEYGDPQRAPLIGRALGEALDLSLVRAKPESEHVCAHLATYTLALELTDQVEKYLVRDVRERRSGATGSSKLCDQNRRLTHDGLDQKI